MKFVPHDYQEYTIKRIIEDKKLALILQMGLGKTVCTLTAIDDLVYNKFVISKVLVIAPLKVCELTWPEEINKWDHLKQLRYQKLLGSETKRLKALNEDADIYLINRENVVWLVDHMLKIKKWPFDMVVVDESSSFKNHSSKRFKKLRQVIGISKRVILLTGTPAPNGLMDLWSQIYLLDKGERLGKTITAYRQEYFYPGWANGHVVFRWELQEGAEELIYDKVRDITVAIKNTSLKMPERVDNVIKLRMPEKIYKKYKELEREYLVTIDENEITAASAGVVANKLLQMANGAVYDEDKNVIHVHDLKIEALIDILEQAQGQPVLVFYYYKHDLERLKEALKDYEPREFKTEEDKKDWDLKRIKVMLAHPDSMGHGLNLQYGGSIAVWFSLLYNLEAYLQANARLDRQGQQDTVVINHLVVEKTRDEHALKRLQQKEFDQNEFINEIKVMVKEAKNDVL